MRSLAVSRRSGAESTSTTGGGRRRIGFIAGLALVAGFALPVSGAQAANPSILNTGTGCAGQTQWLVSCALKGEATDGNVIRYSALISHDSNQTIASLVTDDDWDGTANPANVRSVSATRPATPSGYPRSRANLTYNIPTPNTGMSCGFFSGTRRTSDRNARIQARDAGNQTSTTTSSIVKFTATGQCTGVEDFAYLNSWGGSNFGNSITPGSSVTFTYVGDDPDTTGSSDFNGVNWRVRNLRNGNIVQGPTIDCDGNGDNATKSTSVTFPNRGAFVVEAELMDGSGCSDNQNSGFWFPLGTADVNSASIPAPTVDVPARPNTGTTSINATVTPPTDPDSANGGGTQILQYDLDFNNSNGTEGYEADTIAGEGATLTANQNRTVNITGLTPGQTYTVRARAIDNGAMDAADAIRRTSAAGTDTFTVNTVPTASGQTASMGTNGSQGITLSGTDGDGDALTYNIGSGPSNGSLTGTGANRTYTPNTGFAGTDTFTFTVSDPYNGTSTAATVTINVRPDTSIDSGPANASTVGGDVNFTFSSNATAPNFECRIDGGSYSNCTSPQNYSLSSGSHTFDVRAVKSGQTDPTPATRTFTVDATPPDTSLDNGPSGTIADTTPTFEFSSPDNTATFECRVDGGTYSSCTSPYTTAALSDGSHTVDIRAADPYGNADPTPASSTFTVDTTAPNTTIDSGPSGSTNDTSATFTFSANEGGTSFECSLDGATFTSCTSPATYSGLATGSHTFEVRATDNVGNTDQTPASQTWTITDAGLGSANGGTVTFQAAPGNSNNVTITGGGGALPYVITEAGGGSSLEAGAGCTQVGPTVSCPSAGVTSVVVNLTDGNDTANASTAMGANFTINGGNGNDSLTGSPGDDTLNGGNDAGMDRMDGGPGADSINGGGGIDRALYSNSVSDLNITIDGVANDTDGTGATTENVGTDVESVTGGSGNDSITGSCFANTLAGQGGNDTLNGDPAGCALGGGDFMGGGLGNDAMNGLDGTDAVTYTTNSAAQAINVTLDGAGNDNDGTAGTDNIADDIETIYGGAGNDTIDATDALAGVALWGRAGDDTLIGSQFNDYLRGEAGADNLNCAGGGNDMYDQDPADTVDPSCETAG